MSVPLGLPGWEELVNELRDKAGLASVPERSDEPTLLEAAAQAKCKLGARYSGVLGECLDVRHHALGHGLLASMRVRQSVTTNFDRALELAMATTHEDLKVLTSQWAGQAAPWLLKLHGTAGQSDVVLTKEDYDRHRDEDGQPLYALVQGLLMTSHLLFVGFSMTDSNYLKLAEPVAKLYSRAGGTEVVATVLGLKSLANEERALDEAVHHIPFDEEKRGPGEAARTLEIFLDRVAWRAATLHEEAHAYLLDERYADLVEGQEQVQLKGALIKLQKAVAELDGTGAAWVRAQLKEFGASEDDLGTEDGVRTSGQSASTTDLLTLLRSFNRKERFILLSQGAGDAEPLRVSDRFRERINAQLPETLQIPDLEDGNFVLAMDFHLNWLAAALQLAFRDRSVDEDLVQGPFAMSPEALEGEVSRRWVFERNHEDIDLLIGWRGPDGRWKLVLIEAKAHSSFSTKQLASKSARFAAIFGPDGEAYAQDPVDVALVLAGFRAPQQSQFTQVWEEFSRRETGTHDKRVRFVALDTVPEVLIVGEHDKSGKPKTDGRHWRVHRRAFDPSE